MVVRWLLYKAGMGVRYLLNRDGKYGNMKGITVTVLPLLRIRLGTSSTTVQ